MRARLAMERGAWREAMDLPAPAEPSRFAFVDALTWHAKGIGAVRSGELAAAEKDAAQLASLHKALQDAKNNYWATEVEVMRLGLTGWIAMAGGRNDEAVKLMRGAADLEDKNEKHIMTPGRVVPARELLGDMLLEMKQPALALQEYEMSAEREPNRFRGVYGAARAAEASADRQKATLYYTNLLGLAKSESVPRAELTAAKTFVGVR